MFILNPIRCALSSQKQVVSAQSMEYITFRELKDTKLTALEISEDTVITAGCRKGTDAVTMWKMTDSEMVRASGLEISSEINTVQLHCDLLLFPIALFQREESDAVNPPAV